MLLLLLACHTQPTLRCPEDMALVKSAAGPFCIHTHEARLTGQPGNKDQGPGFPDGSTHVYLYASPGELPSKQLSWFQAYGACRDLGWRLCTSAEWEDACDGKPGPGGRTWPTPDGRLRPGQCNLTEHGQPGFFAPGGSFADCHTPEGVYDLLGNLWEWTDPGLRDETGRPLIDKRGSAHYSAEPQPCSYSSVGTHDPAFDGTIGFRCCADPQEAP